MSFNGETSPLIIYSYGIYMPKRYFNEWKGPFMTLYAVLRVLISETTSSCLKLEHILFFHKTRRPLVLKASVNSFHILIQKMKSHHCHI